MTLEGHELGIVYRRAAGAGRRSAAVAACECGITFTGRDPGDVIDKHAEHVARAVPPAFRSDPRWARLRAACCDILGSVPEGQTLDEYVDVIYSRLMPGNNEKAADAAVHLGGG